MRIFIYLCLPAAISAVGCGAKHELEGGVPVTGMVTYQGQPIEGATVVFRPDGGGTAAAGRTDASGHFQLASQTAGDGALPAMYHVGISKVEANASTITPEEAAKSFKKGPAPAAPTKNLLPAKYMLGDSQLTAEVTANGANDFAFELTD